MSPCYQGYSMLEERFHRIIKLMETKKMNTITLANELGVSRQTVMLMANLLRRRGYQIDVVHDTESCHYQMVFKTAVCSWACRNRKSQAKSRSTVPIKFKVKNANNKYKTDYLWI